ncbi:ATP-binding protein [Streptomyces griseoaurantiacus]|uniref:histidine kinase n=1 Tax=Streptomyces griseoaurantiacus TaxID=68213 RepID=A0A7W2DNY7_9ACTN|nr:ATP-binding protein [Streptomyces griseoaurantiacus]MBA5220037.1 sensor histidine kinase [Streptomyces griseoaurantiacus]
MSVPAPPSQHRPAKPSKASSAVPLAVLVVSAALAGGVAAAAPAGARSWTLGAVAGGWFCLALAVLTGTLLVRRAHRSAAQHLAESGTHQARSAQVSAETAHLVNITLPGLTKRLRDGASAADALTTVQPPSDPQLRQVMHTFAASLEEGVRQAATAEAERLRYREEVDRATAEAERLTSETLPAAVGRLRDGQSADTVLASLEWPRTPLLHRTAESFVRELALSERRAAAAQAASAKALSRVQAKAVSMLADLREMQERHGEEVFGDLLKLDHATSQLGLMTDRLALLMGGRSSRAWNKPIVMESILRGAVGRIAAYQRVRLHCSTTAAISGFAAEGVMHLLAELMDNAANFSPPIDEVHVYVEERSAGLVVTIEDSGLKMAPAAMRRAEQAVAGRMTDLASLQGTRLGVAVVGRLAVKYGISVNYRPSSRGGTGVVVLVPPQLLAQQRDPAPAQAPRRPAAAVPTPGPAPAEPAPAPAPAPAAPAATVRAPEPSPADGPATGAEVPERLPERRRPRDATPNGLPVRTPGHTMAEADRERGQRKDTTAPATRAPERTARDAGSSFGAFHRGRRSGGPSPEDTDRSGTEPEPPAVP